MSEISEAIQEKCLAFSDRIIRLNDYLLEQAANKKPAYYLCDYAKSHKELAMALIGEFWQTEKDAYKSMVQKCLMHPTTEVVMTTTANQNTSTTEHLSISVGILLPSILTPPTILS